MANRCEFEFEDCSGTSLVMFQVKRFQGKGMLWCCMACWRALVGPSKPEPQKPAATPQVQRQATFRVPQKPKPPSLPLPPSSPPPVRPAAARLAAPPAEDWFS